MPETITSHTPGPWKACGTIYEHMNAEIRSGAKGEGQGIAQVWDGPHAFKDALLMAASPEMAEALKPFAEAADYFDGEQHRDSALAGVGGLTAGHLRAARAVLRKAASKSESPND